MSSQTIGHNRTFKAAADYSAKQFYIVYLSAEGIVTLATAATQYLMGTLENKPKLGENAVVAMRHGGATAKVICGAGVTAGHFLTSDGNGKAISTTTPGDEVIGRALMDGSANDIIEYEPMNGKFVTIN
jgi:hypothetical protein